METIYLTLFLNGGDIPSEWPAAFQMNLDLLKAVYPHSKQRIISLDEAREFVRSEFDSDVLAAVDTLQAHAFKSDLVRYCLLWKYGGLYTDIAIRWLRPLPISAKTELIVFKDVPQACTWGINQAIIYSKPGRVEFMNAIESILTNVANRYYGVNSLCPTGPVLFGRSVAIAGAISEYQFGSHRCLTPGETSDTPSYLFDGQLIAVKFKSTHGDISDYGFNGTNNYNSIWESRRVYGEDEWSWRYDHPQLRCDAGVKGENGIDFVSSQKGCQTFGPYIDLEPGTYEVTLHLDYNDFEGVVGVDVTSALGTISLFPYSCYNRTDAAGNKIVFRFEVQQRAPGTEVRVHNERDLSGRLLCLSIKQIR